MDNWDTNLLAPLKTPKPLPNANLISHFLFTRHGCRSPVFQWPNYPIKEIKWPSTNIYADKTVKRRIPIANGVPVDLSQKPKSGFLLDSGNEQHKNLGKLYYNYLAIENSLLNKEEDYDLSQIFLRFSYSPRCIESGTSFMHGMYKPKVQGEKLIIQTGEPKTEVMCVHPTINDYFLKITEKFVQTDEVKYRIAMIPDEIKKMFSFQHSVDNLLIGDFPLCLKFNNFKLPSIIEEDDERSKFVFNKPFGSLYGLLLSNLASFSTGYVNYCGPISYRPLFKFLGDRIRKFLNNETKAKFTLFSGHDITISSVLAGIGHVNMKSVPPYSSHLAVELWDTKYRQVLRFVMNGEPIKVKGLDTIDVQSFLKEFC